MATRSVGVVKESAPGEHRVAVVPAVVPRLREHGPDVLVENDAGTGAFLPDSAYTEAGAVPVGRRVGRRPTSCSA